MKEISNKEDIKILVDAFYNKVRTDQLIGPVFAGAIPNDKWPKHLERMYSFWNTVLFGSQEYRGNPFSKHSSLPISKPHFDRWLELLDTTIDTHFEGEKADEMKRRATNMGMLFQSKLEHIRANDSFKNIV